MIELPPGVVPMTARPGYLDFGGVLRPSGGGRLQRVDRLGNRFRLELDFPPHRTRELGRVVVTRLIRAKSEGLRVELPNGDDAPPGGGGGALVDGSGQAGTVLALRQVIPGTILKEGRWLSIERDGQHYAHKIVGTTQAAGDTRVVVSIAPMMREQFVDGDRVFLERPLIEGMIDGDEWGWEESVDNLTSFSVSIQEAA